MSAIELGKRYERLMMSSAPLAIAAAFLLFTSIASKDQGNSDLSRCYELAASAVSVGKEVLQRDWDENNKYKDVPGYTNLYPLQLRLQWVKRITPWDFKRCTVVTAAVEASGDVPPDELEKKWLAEARKRYEAPIAMHGISIESQTEITVLGTKVRVQLATLTTALQFALGPLLVLWLGSLYQTRFRESIHNAKARSLVEVYPHLINVYPSHQNYAPKKRVKLLLFFNPKKTAAVLFTVTRIMFVAVVLSPTVALYLWSLWLIPSYSQSFSHIALGSMVGAFSLAVLAAEALPWHWSKTFPQIEPT